MSGRDRETEQGEGKRVFIIFLKAFFVFKGIANTSVSSERTGYLFLGLLELFEKLDKQLSPK